MTASHAALRWARQPTNPTQAPVTRKSAEFDPDTQAEKWLCCRCCGTRVAREATRLEASSALFVNPTGHAFDIIRVGHAESVVPIGVPSTEATWFAGYAWVVVICAVCRRHLGWQYRAVTPGAAPASFYGLIRDELVERAAGA